MSKSDLREVVEVTIKQCRERAVIPEEISPVTLNKASELIATLHLENNRLREGLKLIINGASTYGASWCKVQAEGYLHDLDFDHYPETGKETE